MKEEQSYWQKVWLTGLKLEWDNDSVCFKNNIQLLNVFFSIYLRFKILYSYQMIKGIEMKKFLSKEELQMTWRAEFVSNLLC